MKKMLINVNYNEEIRIALIDKSWLYDLYIENFNNSKKKSNIYLGKVIHIEISLEAIFINYGCEKPGFLPFKEISCEYLKEEYFKFENKDKIKEYIKSNQIMLVQVIKEERFNKGAVLTTFISLSGSYIVLMPNNAKLFGISKRIDIKNKKLIKENLKNLKFPEQMGIIIRTSGLDKSLNDLQNDLNLRIEHWKSIQSLYNKTNNPSLIYKENSIINKIFKDYLTEDISEIIIDNENFINDSKNCLNNIGKYKFSKKINFYSNEYPIFSYYNIENQIELAFERNIRLPSGGSITIDFTEALTSIDVNSAKSTKFINIENTALHTNLEAVNEISRQLRLRNLGGLIVIDFIDMQHKYNCKEVEENFKKCVYQDKAKIKFGNISKFGLLEISRQRLTNSLNESNYYICPRCKGNRFIRNHKSLSLLILRLIKEKSLQDNIKEVHVIVPVTIGSYLLNEKRNILNNIEKNKFNKFKIIIVPYDKIKIPNYYIYIKKYNNNNKNKFITSYLLPFIYDKNIKNNNKLFNTNYNLNIETNNIKNKNLNIFKYIIINFINIKYIFIYTKKILYLIINNIKLYILNLIKKIKNIFFLNTKINNFINKKNKNKFFFKKKIYRKTKK